MFIQVFVIVITIGILVERFAAIMSGHLSSTEYEKIKETTSREILIISFGVMVYVIASSFQA
jgi:hypothetical protein